MTDQVDGRRVREVLAKRGDALAAIADRPIDKPELVEALGVSRSTVDRAVTDLVRAELIRELGKKYEPTHAGELALDIYREYTGATDALGSALPLLATLPDDAPIGTELIEGSSVALADPHAPEAALEGVISRLDEADTLRGFAPVVKTNYVSMLYDQVRTGGLTVEIIVESGTFDPLLSVATTREEMVAFLENPAVSVYETDESLPYALWLLEGPSFQRTGVTVHENGAIVGVLTNDRSEAVQSSRNLYQRIRGDATPLTTEISD